MSGQILIIVSEPWDFVTQHGSGPFTATTEDVSEQQVAIRLRQPLDFRNEVIALLVATPRHIGDVLEVGAAPIHVNLTPILEHGRKATDFDAVFRQAAAWRGWHLIGSIKAA